MLVTSDDSSTPDVIFGQLTKHRWPKDTLGDGLLRAILDEIHQGLRVTLEVVPYQDLLVRCIDVWVD